MPGSDRTRLEWVSDTAERVELGRPNAAKVREVAPAHWSQGRDRQFTVKGALLLAVPIAVVAVMGPVVAPIGTMATI